MQFGKPQPVGIVSRNGYFVDSPEFSSDNLCAFPAERHHGSLGHIRSCWVEGINNYIVVTTKTVKRGCTTIVVPKKSKRSGLYSRGLGRNCEMQTVVEVATEVYSRSVRLVS